MLDDRSGPLQKNGGDRIIIFPHNILNEKVLKSRNKYSFVYFLALELSPSCIDIYRWYIHKPVVTLRKT